MGRKGLKAKLFNTTISALVLTKKRTLKEA